MRMDLQNNLKRKYIAYLDVLGFKELVYSRDTNRLEAYFNTIRETLDDLKEVKGNIESLLISDSTILVSPDSLEDFRTLVLAVQTIQTRLAYKNIWLRGAICFGEVFYDKRSNLIVGKGLIDAYLLEQEAKYPRVIINPSIIPKLANNSHEFLMEINPESRGRSGTMMKLIHTWGTYIENDAYFVSYGHRIVLDSISEGSLEDIYNLIFKNLYSSPKNYDKYLWVKRYFMDVLRDLKDVSMMGAGTSAMERAANFARWFKKFSEL